MIQPDKGTRRAAAARRGRGGGRPSLRPRLSGPGPSYQKCRVHRPEWSAKENAAAEERKKDEKRQQKDVSQDKLVHTPRTFCHCPSQSALGGCCCWTRTTQTTPSCPPHAVGAVGTRRSSAQRAYLALAATPPALGGSQGFPRPAVSSPHRAFPTGVAAASSPLRVPAAAWVHAPGDRPSGGWGGGRVGGERAQSGRPPGREGRVRGSSFFFSRASGGLADLGCGDGASAALCGVGGGFFVFPPRFLFRAHPPPPPCTARASASARPLCILLLRLAGGSEARRAGWRGRVHLAGGRREGAGWWGGGGASRARG